MGTRRGDPRKAPLSPLLSNVYLDDLDRELGQRRIHAINRFTGAGRPTSPLAEGETPFRELDEWLRRRLGQVLEGVEALLGPQAEPARPRGFRALCPRVGRPQQRLWRIARSWVLSRTLTDAYWQEQDLLGLTGPYRRLRDAERAARCGPACLERPG